MLPLLVSEPGQVNRNDFDFFLGNFLPIKDYNLNRQHVINSQDYFCSFDK